jgi:nitrile hydratase alpha subunit
MTGLGRHDHDHDHEPIEADDSASIYKARQEALEQVLIAKGILTAEEVSRAQEKAESAGPHLGAKLVARAWVDETFKSKLLADAKSAAAQLGIEVTEADLTVVENSPHRHHMIVCTLCSCYPRSLLGQPPAWYVSKAYRARAVSEPRQVLNEFGLELAAEVEIQVHDSNAELRYMVLPMRPDGTEGWSEDRLAGLVGRDSLIGTALPAKP